MALLRLLQSITNHPVNQNQKIRSLVRFFKWQVGSRLIGNTVVHNWVDGARFYVKTGEEGLTGNIYNGLHEFPDMGYLLHVTRKDDLFLDVGANVGSYTLLSCAAREARGYAFEPIPSTYAKLAANIRLNGIESRVNCMNLGLGNEEGVIKFTSDMNCVNHVLAPDEKHDNFIEVKVVTLDSVVSITGPTLMKIDVEGFETPVLEGAANLLQNTNLHSVIMELNGSGSRYGFDEGKILSAMLGYGFKTYSYDPLTRTLSNLDGKNLKSGNTLFIRDEEFVLERLKAAPKTSVLGRSI